MKKRIYTYTLNFRPQEITIEAANQKEARHLRNNILRRMDASRLIDKSKSNLTVKE